MMASSRRPRARALSRSIIGSLIIGVWLAGTPGSSSAQEQDRSNQRASSTAAPIRGGPDAGPSSNADQVQDQTKNKAKTNEPAGQRTPASERFATAAECLRQGMERERSRNWTGAIELYADGLKRWPSANDLSERKRLCQIHHRLGKRYQDPSFRKVLLPLSRERAENLYGEVIDQILANYVDTVMIAPLVRNGFDNLEVALRDPLFLNAHAPRAAKDQVKRVREALRQQRNSLKAKNLAEAFAWIDQACGTCQRSLGVPPSPVLLEFVFGACEALDEYTSYLTPNKLDDIYSMIDGNFVGLGVELKFDADSLLLVGVIKGGPAAESGLRIGDRIVRIDGQPLAGLNLDESASKLQGPEGSEVKLTIRRRDGQSRDLRIQRRSVEVESVAQARIIDPENGIGYIQLIGFQRSSSDEIRKAVAMLNEEGMKRLILDLRDNPGGLLHIAIEIANQFLDSGRIVSTKGRAHGQSMDYWDQTPAIWRMPMAILIDHSSASASEILAGALQENNRALIIGETSYGKGSVQSIFSLKSAHAGLKLTTAKFFSPLDRPYTGRGVIPDLAVRTVAKPPSNAGERNDASQGSSEARIPQEFGDLKVDSTLIMAVRQSDRFLSPSSSAPKATAKAATSALKAR